MKRTMKRTILAVALLLGGGLAAHADTSIYANTLKQPRGDDALHADTRICDQRVGPDRNGVPTSAAYKQCMRSLGWRYERTRRERVTPQHTWIDPDTGDTCHAILGGFGSVCSNF